MWSVAVPALVAENAGIIASFGRSRALTKGSRWPIFGVLLVSAIIIYVPIVVFGASLGLGSLASSSTRMAASSGLTMLTIIGPIYGVVVASFLNALLTSLYLETRLVKDGVATGTLATVFE